MSKEIELKKVKGITLISLVITIIILIILSSVAIYLSLGNNGIFNKAKEAKELTNKQEATERINLKITTAQMNKYAEKQEMPTLQELADTLYEDNEIQYVALETQVGSKEKITVGEKTSIFTKLKQYPYEFEINSSLQLASINGVKLANTSNSYAVAPEGEQQVLDENFDQNEHTIIAPDDGWIVLSAISSGTGGKYYNLEIGNLRECGGDGDAWQTYAVSLPCKKGQEIIYNVWGNNVSGLLQFIPMK